MMHTQNFLDDGPETTTNPRSKIEIEVCLHEQDEYHFLISLDETSKRFAIKRRGVKILRRNGKVVTLRLSEKKAITYNLV